MAVDGSFCVEYELERFLGRCPRLASVPQLDYLAKKGSNLTEDELINGVAELFLHPRYTIPLVGCFRPITQRIIDRVVALLRLVPDLTSNSNDSMVELDEERLFKEAKNSDDDEIVSVINLYVECGRGLSLHELSCLAFSRALDLVPYVLGSVRSYFSFAPPPFKRIMEKEFMDQSLTQAGTHLLNAVRVSYRLLLAEPEVFTKLWDWSCYLDLVQKSKIVNGGDAALLMDIQWSAVQVLSFILKMNDKFMRKKNKMSDPATVDFGFDAEEAFWCLLRWQEFLQDVSLEKAGWCLEPPGETKLDSSAKEIKDIHDQQSQSLGHTSSVVSWVKRPEIGQSSSSNMEATWDRTTSGRAFVLTPTVKKSFEMVLLAVSQRWPVLLYGPPGAGKTALISRLAQIHGSRVLTIHMDEQIDGKTLIGSYVCAEQPGEFRWQPGSLTQAILNGLWVVFEDIDKAAADVQSILLPLLEGGTSFLTGHGEPIRVSEGFRLFSTVSNSRDASGATTGRNSLGALWRRVMLGPSNSGDLKSIVKAWHPELEPLSGRLIETFERVSQISGFQLGAAVTFRVAGRFSLRDLLKWCKRIAGLGFHFGGNTLSAYVSKSIYQEAVDVFASSSGSADIRLAIMKEIAEIWAVPISAVIRLYPVDKPMIQDLRSEIRIGRVTLQRAQMTFSAGKKPFVEIRNSLHVLERIAGSVKYNEPVLLVGETGTGKTTLVQNLAARLGQKLTVLNLSQQSDVADLLGGFKPMNAQFICLPLYQEFENLFARSFSSERNEDFLASLKIFVSHKNWNMLFSGFQKGVLAVDKRVNSGPGSKRKRALSEELKRSWEIFSVKLKAARAQINASDGMVFSFVEGAFVTALKKGEWILLDEVNLAPPETLQRVVGVLEEEGGSLCLAERGDVDYIYRHPDFRIFACMNPATDAGKRDLPFSLRSRFTEYFVDDVTEDEDLILFVNQFMDGHHSDRELTSKVVQFYKVAKRESEERLQDGANQKPQYSLRSLYRALEYAKKARRNFGFQKAIYDGFSMFFLTLLDLPSAKVMNQLILRHLLGGSMPTQVPFDRYLEIGVNPRSDDFMEKYVLTKSVKEQLSNLARAIFIGRYPVLLQGPTSSGKTSLVQYLAAITGHEFVRVNNHEHTDLQEYLGSYITGANGKLVFQEGVLVKAVRHGYWIVLDELNLAPSDVLEALNRLLDDNREIFVPELRETIRAHPDFMLFATQNPPTLYGGRKMLSRAFRNRFVEVHVDEIPQDELCTILERRCEIPDSYAKKMVEVMKELQLHRQSSKVFAGKHGFITPRDLFRWANRFRTFGKSYEDLARDGYYLLAERLRDDAEKKVVQEVLEKQLRVKLCSTDMYKEELATGNSNLDLHKSLVASEDLGRIIWTDSMRRLYFLVERCYRLREPVLLVGETGGGKTTVCQLLSIALGSKLHILNCHQYTETSDFLGGFYPVRERSELSAEFKILCEQLVQSKAIKYFPRDATISFDINEASAILNQVDIVIKDYRQGQASHPEVTEYELDSVEQIRERLSLLHQKWCTIFVWQDGPLVRSMKDGDLFLVDEISLADDSVLERLNSVLEPERKLSLAEKGGPDLENVTAHPNFFLLATMNPGGDYGKKELSPALRNRFTEIWVPPVADLNELKCIALEKISNPEVSYVVDVMMSFWKWFNQLHTGRMLTVRDLLSWVAFINVSVRNLRSEVALLHGAFLVLLDGLSLGTGISKSEAEDLRERCMSFMMGQLKESILRLNQPNCLTIENYGWTDFLEFADTLTSDSKETSGSFGIHPFYIEKGDEHFDAEGFDFQAPTTRRNALRVLRAMQLKKPVLLEGSPGVGKTSLIVALGKISAHSVVRINLSEQTDIMDLLGSDLPVESDEGMQFAWSDGILLQALKKGSWVLLDELNLAPQSVLEGLNAILDHRAEVFIPELGHTFKCPSSFRVFACQNPSNQGGGRKGLPKSFLNRFTKVYVDELGEEDYVYICSSLYPSIPMPLLLKLILFNKRLHEETMLHHRFGQDGSPWEFNLRDVVRSCQIIQGAPESSRSYCFLNTVYVQRMRSATDRQEVIRLYEQVFGLKPFINLYPRVQLNPENLIVGNTYVKRNYLQLSKVSSSELKILPEMRQSLEAVANCLHHQWLVLLIGPSASGKTSLIRLLAQLTGNVLNELNLSSATDISELLGCFEQYNAIRNYRLAVERVERYINEYCCLQIETSTEAFTRRKYLISRWLAFLSKTDYHASSSVSASAEPFSSLPLLVEIIEILRLNLENDSNDLNRLLKTIRKLQDDPMRRLYSAKFEWVTGLLIKAIENGEWIVLENANLCNPTVLDRINSLVEQSGSITVNECGTVDGKPVVLHPHPEFRMFLTVNPTYGEVSRAMRNRGVEIYMLQPYWLLGETGEETELKDVKRFLALSNIPSECLVDAMAKAHISAKRGGLQHGVSISNLELMRWVQLFQRLLTNGNQPSWSLQISWEHTYLSSLGEVEGKDVVNEAINSYLSMPELYSFKSLDCSLCLPGGWPAPLKVHDFVWYSNEATVKQNCMYLEYLGAQASSHSFRIASAQCTKEHFSSLGDSMRKYMVDVNMLHVLSFPNSLGVAGLGFRKQTGFELTCINKKLLFAANWTIEQATETDLKMYLLWLSWFGDQLQGYCPFYHSFLNLVNKELDHSIWNCIKRCRGVLLANSAVDMELKSIPLLSLDLADLTASVSKSCSELLVNAINSVGLLRLSYQQWHAESEFIYSDKTRCFANVLRSLRKLEERILDMLVESPSFNVLFELYRKLLDDHLAAWNSIVSSQFECVLVSWRLLTKDVIKLLEFCPHEVQKFQEDNKNLEMVLSYSFNSQRSLLWVHGGHPFSPSSVEVYRKQQELVNLCESIWPREFNLQELDRSSIDAAVSTNPEMRFLAMQGVCMSAYIMSKAKEEDLDVQQQLEEMHQMLLSKFDHEKDKLEGITGTNEQISLLCDLSNCCILNPEILCRTSALSCWLHTQPLNDYTSFHLDMRLLQQLSDIVLLNGMELQSGLSRLGGLLVSTLKFSLNFSSRPPTDFSPHQKILWVLDAWNSVNSVHAHISSSVLEMWFKWHTSLWKHQLDLEKNLNQHGCHGLLPDMLFQPVKTVTIDKILRCSIGIKDFSVHGLKLRVASRNLWLSSPHVAESRSFLLSAARSLFQQIILAHKNSFEAYTYSSIRSIFCSAKEKMVTQADVNVLISLLASSSHHVFKSMISSLIKPLLDELYLQSSKDSLYDLGCAWLHIGGLRYHLLVCCDDVDPVVKNNFKYFQLSEKIASLELEIEVRQECAHLAGCFSLSEPDRKIRNLLEKLKADRKKLERKIVFRSDPGKFKKLRSECDEFMKLVATSFVLVKKVGNLNVQRVADQVHNWQETAARFVERLSKEYNEYVDIVQPVQVAIYEMKLGLSLVLSSGLHKQFSDRFGQDNIDVILGAIYSFVRFPRGIASKDVSYENIWHANLSSFDEEFPTHIGVDMNMLETWMTCMREDNSGEKVSVLQLKAAIHHNILLRVVHSAAEAHFLDNASFMLLDKMFDEFASLWMNMKVQVRTKEEHDAQQYRFRPRAFIIESVIETDIATLESSIANEAFSEWRELASEGMSTEGNKDDGEHEILEETWNSLQESKLTDMVHIHNALFGSMDLLHIAGSIQVSDSDRLRSFMDSYALGARVIKDLEGLLSSNLETKLIPEHVLRLCLEHDLKFSSSYPTADAYNFYKDSNASLMAKMIHPVTNLQGRIRHLLSEWDDHPSLQKILDAIEMILSIPLTTPLAKALSGLQFLLNRVRSLQETVSKFPLSDQLKPIEALVTSWQKLEFDSWPALLDEVQARFDITAGQLWFPLYSVLRHRHSAGTDDYSQSTIQSLEEFIQTSSIGEFRKRLQLLFAFHGQFSTAMNRGCKSSYCHEDNLKILYNTFGFYVQFLPIIMERLTSNRRSIEVELNDLLKMSWWKHGARYLTMETSKHTRQKFKKLIQKYTDMLQEPVKFIITQEAARSGIRTAAMQALGPTQFNDSLERNRHILRLACDQSLFGDKERYPWPATWRDKVDLAMENMRLSKTIKSDYSFIPVEEAEVNASIISKCITSQSRGITREEWEQVWYTIEKISTAVTDCCELWKVEKKSLGKRRALSEFLKLLDSCGLSKHRSTFLEDQLKTNNSSRWFLQPSYVMQHLLPTEGRLSSGDNDVAALEKVHNLLLDNVEIKWQTANEYFFKSIAALGHLRQVCLNFHKDFTLEQVNRSVSYLDHLIEIQKEQRAAAYDFSESMERLKKCSLPLQSLFSSPLCSPSVTTTTCSFSHNQHIVLKCMWQQKKLFDDMCRTLHDECLLLKTVENNHLSDCESVGAAAGGIRLFVEKFVPDFNNSKELLDKYLLGHSDVLVSASVLLHPCGITTQMEQLVQQNFSFVREFREQLGAFHEQDAYAGSVKTVLIDHFEDILAKGDLIAEDYESALEARRQSGKPEDVDHLRHISEVNAGFVESLRKTCKHIVDAFDRVGSVNNGHDPSGEALANISNWGNLFVSRIENLQLGTVYDALVRTINFAGELVDHYGNGEPSVCLVIEAHLKHLYSLLELLITYGDGLLNDFLVVHRTVAIITHVLAKIFASLYSQGFGSPAEDQEDENDPGKTQDASGTGMGEGAGVKDVSEQIEDEDQLLGTSEKFGEEQDALNDVPSKNDRGIEMEQDFTADAFSVSEDSGDDDDDDDKSDEDKELESAMGETGADSEIIDEKHWDNKDDNNENSNKNEKYESGPSVKDNDPSGRELRAKEDNVTAAEEPGEDNPDDSNKLSDEKDGDQGPDDTENVEDMEVDKEEAFSEPTGLKLDEPNVGPEKEDINMNEQGVDNSENDGAEASDEPPESDDGELESTNPLDCCPDQTEPETSENIEMDDAAESNQEKDSEKETAGPTNDVTAPVTSDFGTEHQSNAESATQPIGGSHAPSLRNIAPEAQWSNTSDLQSELAPVKGLPNSSENEITITDSSKGGKLGDDQWNQLTELDSSSSQKNVPNPLRNVGDALDGWKERAKVNVDLEEKNDEAMDVLEDENAAEYGFTSGLDKGTAQALGPAASDQIDRNIEGKEPTDGDDNGIADRNDCSEMDMEEQHLESQTIKSHSLNTGNKVSKQKEVPEVEMQHETPEAYNPGEGDQENQSESLVRMKRSYMHDDINQFGKLSVSGDDLGRAHSLEDVSGEMRDNAAALWRRYELLTTRLSQELAEQLRLVMEPTLASKLQGDYKTGKRINMKKVIPYIASHYRKDKIWLRRTRPNKRNYQVVIAVDDSRSMSESHCGDVAIEALVTVCRAMSQLEVGNLAVASFGRKGNIRLLHDFDQPFNGEAGVKMLSSLTFKQENTIADEPVVDLLKYLNNMLDAAVINARLPSGHNPLEQLVLIIADGRFHEKENLKRCVRDILSKKRMVAFLLLDSPQESIMDLTEASFQGGSVKIVKYLDSFPFPFYVVLKDIEALPRTLADLLRQWFELMQQSGD